METVFIGLNWGIPVPENLTIAVSLSPINFAEIFRIRLSVKLRSILLLCLMQVLSIACRFLSRFIMFFV